MQVNNQTSAPGPASALKHEHTPRERGTGFDHIQGLDGLRAFSVIAVLMGLRSLASEENQAKMTEPARL